MTANVLWVIASLEAGMNDFVKAIEPETLYETVRVGRATGGRVTAWASIPRPRHWSLARDGPCCSWPLPGNRARGCRRGDRRRLWMGIPVPLAARDIAPTLQRIASMMLSPDWASTRRSLPRRSIAWWWMLMTRP